MQADSSLCIILPDMPGHSQAVQDLLNFWHQQDAMHALSSADAWIFVQLPGFVWSRARKSEQRYSIVE